MGDKFGPGHPFIRMANAVPLDEVRKQLEVCIALAGSAKALARIWKVSPQYVCDLRKGRRAFTDELLNMLGYKRIIVMKSNRGVK